MMRRTVLAAGVALGLTATVGSATAAIYRWVDSDGVVNYGDDVWRFEAHRRQANPEKPGAITDTTRQRPATAAEPAAAATPIEGAGRIEDVVVEVMRLSGLDQQVSLVAAMIRDQFDRWVISGARFPAGAAHLVARRFDADVLRSSLRQSLGRHLDQPQAAALLRWLRDPLSQRIVALENRATAAQPAELDRFINHLPSTPPGPTRLALIHRLQRAGEVIDTSATVAAATVAALRRIVTPAASADGVVAQAGFDGQADGIAVDESYRLRIMTSLLYTYRDLSDAELARYVTVLESPTGRWFTRVTRLGFLAALESTDRVDAGAGNRRTR